MAKRTKITRKHKEQETAREFLRRTLRMPKAVVREINEMGGK